MAKLLTVKTNDRMPVLLHREKENVKKDNFFSGFFILTLSTVIVKVIGLVYKIPMLGLLGSEGMGYFNSAYEIYALFCVISTAGLPVAMSVMIAAKGESRAGGIFKVALKLFLMLGIAGTVIMLAMAQPFASFLKSDKAAPCIFTIAPTVFFICLCSAYRGYFQGLGSMLQTAVSQVIEALGKLMLGLVFSGIAFAYGLDTSGIAACGVLGLTLGTAISALYLALSKKISHRKYNSDGIEQKGVAKELLRAAIPITLSSAVLSVTKLIDMSMILRRLQSIGYSSESAFSAYGSYTTLAVPLFSLAPAIISSVALPLVPTLSRAIANGDKNKQTDAVADALKLTSIIAMPLGLGMSLFSRQILELVFRGESDAVTVAAPLLTILGMSVTMSCYITVGNAILHAYGRPVVPIISMAAGAAVKIALAFLLIGIKDINIMGAPISTFACDLTINLVNFAFICKLVPQRIKQTNILIRPFSAAVISVVIGRIVLIYVSGELGDTVSSIACIALTAVIYVFACLIFRAVDKNDIAHLPIIKRFIKE